METKYNFTKFTLTEFRDWIKNLKVDRTILRIMEHHTYIPDYSHFNGSNHFERQLAMKNYHVYQLGWMDIGQHFTVFPDGTILTGRSIEVTPSCIANKNSGSICIENVGNFDHGADKMTKEQEKSIVEITALLCEKFNLPIDTNSIIYHHWYSSKTCPGENFFNGNSREDCEKHFLPKVKAALNSPIKKEANELLRFASVTASALNIRTGPGTSHKRATDNPSVPYNSILRVYNEKGGWLKISKSKERWVSGRYTTDVQRAVVKVKSQLNVRRGPSPSYGVVGKLENKEIVFLYEEQDNWCKISAFDEWVYKPYLVLDS